MWNDTYETPEGFSLAKRLVMPDVTDFNDLFYDALWIQENVTGPIEFDFLVRPWGTNIGFTSNSDNSARVGVRIGAGESAEFYHVVLFVERRRWKVTFTQVPLEEIKG